MRVPEQEQFPQRGQRDAQRASQRESFAVQALDQTRHGVGNTLHVETPGLGGTDEPQVAQQDDGMEEWIDVVQAALQHAVQPAQVGIEGQQTLMQFRRPPGIGRRHAEVLLVAADRDPAVSGFARRVDQTLRLPNKHARRRARGLHPGGGAVGAPQVPWHQQEQVMGPQRRGDEVGEEPHGIGGYDNEDYLGLAERGRGIVGDKRQLRSAGRQARGGQRLHVQRPGTAHFPQMGEEGRRFA